MKTMQQLLNWTAGHLQLGALALEAIRNWGQVNFQFAMAFNLIGIISG
mgnify:CR=1 FL=1